jgi:hypothetical protein
VSDEGVNFTDFHSYMRQSGTYIFIPDRSAWPRDRIDARLPAMPLVDKQGRPVLDPERR